MKRSLCGAALGAVLWACQSPPAAPSALRLDDFAYAIELRAAPDEALQTVLVPLAVYTAVTREDLGDLRVFDAQGREAPHALRALGESRAPGAQVSVPIFPLFEREQTAGAPELSLHVKRSSDGAVIDLRSTKPAPDQPGERIAGYVLDLRAVETPVRALQLELDPAATHFVAEVEVDASSDLSHWRRLQSRVALARLEYAGQRIDQDRIELPATRGPFLRLRASTDLLPARLLAVHADLLPGEIEPKRETLRVQGTPVGDGHAFDFDLGGSLPVERVSIELPQDNTLVHAELESRAGPSTGAEPRFSGTVYRVRQHGSDLRSPPIAFERLRRRYFRLNIDARGGGLAGQRPALGLEYVPEQLLFIARGVGPFQLAYGHAGATSTAFSPEQLRAVVGPEKGETLAQQTASPGEPRTLAGRSALSPRPPPPPLKTYALWTVLIVAAGVVLLMALRMLKQ